jgi:hypothetical protein
MINSTGVTIAGIWGVAEFSSGQIEVPGKLRSWAHFQWKTDRTWNTKLIEHFITFLTRGRAQNFNFERRTYDQMKLIDITRYDFLFWINFKFPLVLTFIDRMVCFSKFILFIHMHMQCHDICRSYMFLAKIKVCPIYIRCTYIRWQSHSSS